MSKGYVMMAMGNDYIDQAYLCAKSIKQTQTINNVCLITNDTVPEEYKDVFDKIIPIPWQTSDDFYRTEDRWKIFHVTPYTENIVLDTDIIFLTNIDYIWTHLQKYDVCFPENVYTYRGIAVKDSYYRQSFDKNNLPNIYCGMHYFKKSDIGLEYYKNLELVCKNFKEFYDIYVKKSKPKVSSMDLNHAITVLNMQLPKFTSSVLSFVHMKSKVQEWESSSTSWIDDIQYYVDTSMNVKIGNYKQSGVFHYTEHKFCKKLLEKINVC